MFLGWGVLLRRCIAAKLPLDAASCRWSGSFKGDFAAGAAIWRQDQFLNKFKELSRTQFDMYIAWRYNGFMYIDLRYMPCLFWSGTRTSDSGT